MYTNRLLMVALLCAAVYALGTFSESIVMTGTSANDDDLYPVYKLGFLPNPSQVTIQLKINATIAQNPLNFYQVYIVIQGSNWGAKETLIFSSDPSVLQVKKTLIVAGHYKMKVILGAAALVPNALTFFPVFVASAFIKVGTINPVITPIFKDYIDVARPFVVKIIYLQAAKTINVSLTYLPSPTSAPQLNDIAYASVNITNFGNLLISSFGGIQVTSTQPLTGASKSIRSKLLQAGYHGIVYRNRAEANNVLLSVQTDPYPCPFSSTSTDLHGTFPGCTPQGTNTGNGAVFPCITVTSSTCTKCYFGYTLVGTSCVYNPCNDDQYYSNLTCIKASVYCLVFDRFTGVCQSCVNSNYTLTSGACNVKPCPSGQSIKNNTCVNNYCNGFSLISGFCTSCINNAFELNNGICAPVKCFAANLYFSFAVQACIVYPSYCTSINFITEKCTACLIPFTLNANSSLCQLICNLPQVRWFDQCVNLPQNCDAINIVRQCSRCKPNFSLTAGRCEQTGTIIINNP